MKKIYLNLSLLLLTLMAGLSGCSKTDVNPDQPGAKSTTQDAVVTGYMVKAYMFLREPGPFGLGHTALGYEVRELSGSTITKVYTYCGGIENGGGLPFVSPGDNNGGWLNYDLTNNVSMLSRMRSRGYTSYKYVANFSSTSLTNLNNASNALHNFPFRGYVVATNNCANGVYDVLTAIAAPGMVRPFYNWAPRDQFNKVTGWSGAVSL